MIRAFLVLLLLALLSIGSWTAYRHFFHRKNMQTATETSTSTDASTNPPVEESKPDPVLAAYRSAVDEASTGSLVEAATKLRALAAEPSAAQMHDAALALLGEVNMTLLFSPTESPDKTEIVVKPGDTLNKIASRTGIPAGLVVRANNLQDINIRAGAKLFIPVLSTSIEIRFRSANLTVLNNGAFLVRYPLVGGNMPGGIPLPVQTVIREKIALKNEKRVAFGEADYIDAYRWLPLTEEDFHILSQPTAAGKPKGAPAGGFQLAPADMDELFLLVGNKCPVTILDE